MTASRTKPRPPNFETGEIWSEPGWIPYEWSERYCICVEAGVPDDVARRVAADEIARRVGERMGHGGK
jgi:hypothetical protein